MREKTIYLTPLRDSLKKSVLLVLMFLGATFLWQGVAQIGPIEVTPESFTADVVAEGVGDMIYLTTANIDFEGFCLISEDWKLEENSDPLINIGLPVNGVINSPDPDIEELTYQIPPYGGNNSLRIDNNIPPYSGDLTLSSPERYVKLYFLVLSGNGASEVEVTVNFTDNTVQNFYNLSVPDWYTGAGLPVELSDFGRGYRADSEVEYYNSEGFSKLFRLQLDITEENQLKLVESITFTKTNTNYPDESVLNIIAISGEENNDCIEPCNSFINPQLRSRVEN